MKISSLCKKYGIPVKNMYFLNFDYRSVDLFNWVCMYFVHFNTPSGAAGWAWLGCLGWRGRPRAAEEQKVLKNNRKMARNFPGLFVFHYFWPS